MSADGEKNHLFHQVNDLIRSANNIFVQAHARCGDATGSVLAMTEYLRSLGKQYLAFLPDQVPANFSFMPGVEEIVTDKTSFNLAEFDLLLILDCGDLGRTEITDKILAEKNDNAVLVNIDHHYTNDYFGDINIVDKQAPATSVLIHQFFQANNVRLNKSMATNLLVGIFTDTGIFTNPATNQEALAKAADLLISGASVNSIVQSIFSNRSVKGLKLWARAFERLAINRKYNLAYTIILQRDLVELGLESEEELEPLSNFLNNLNDADIVLVLREKPGNKIKGALRTVKDKYDVGKLAALFGGGGHKKASGFTIEGRLFFNEEKGRWEVV